ncbi:hypothetical protein [Superficieibacter sp. HKU1]|uniref:hypothetical protein n=1 Tax=Superficieibacter sp. HKU1 TaxID=3031919 RepID=UPI0023E161C5|nr:hypothetical protein [Superficieibacter sp. HKU1]WES67213.1 hypothetical protein P0H77_16485 [Superficieibacter sp. HKU1]
MKAATTKKFFQIVDIPDYRYPGNKDAIMDIDFNSVATDCDTKTISLLEAINILGINILNETDGKKTDSSKISMLSGIICDLAELAIATNKISQSAAYSSGYKDAENV